MQTTVTRDEAMQKLPQVLEIQKRKLLTVISQATAEVSPEDELLVKNFTESLKQPLEQSIQWEDSEASQCVQNTLKKHASFDLYKYLDCAENVCDAFSDKNNSYPEVYSSMEYVLTHAREFGDPTESIFQIESSNQTNYRAGSARLKEMEGVTDSKIVTPAKQLIAELRTESIDQEVIKFETLNALITSFVLMILRRSLKNLTDCIFYTPRALVIDAYLNTTDEKTKKNMLETCVKYMAWNDLQMPYLFCKVLDLYDIEAGFLWDLLCSVTYNKQVIATSLINFATEYYTKYLLQRAYPLQRQRWFPYCRLFDKDYHRKLSNNENLYICAVLIELIERKNLVNEELAIKSTSTIFTYTYRGVKETVTKLCMNIIEASAVNKV